MLRAVNIHKSFKDLHVLKGISLEVLPSEIVAIVGKSGSGKTTLLQILGTLAKADAGEIYVEDKLISQYSANQIATLRNESIGFVFQFHHLLAEFTALENVTIPSRILKTPKAKYDAKAKELLDYLGLKDRMTHKPAQLSGGEQQRVAIARALINNPKIIFADEPTGNLDGANAEEFQKLLFRLRDDFKHSFVMVTHNLELANSSDRCFNLVAGKLQA